MNNNFKDEIVIAVLERTIRRLWILCLVSIALFVVSNVGWIYYESQFEDVTTETVEQDIDTSDNDGSTIISGIGNIDGTDKTESDTN